MREFECPICHDIYETDEVENEEDFVCKSCRRKARTKIYLYIAILILLIGFIVGIICGSVFATCNDVSLYSISSTCKDSSFNVLLMFVIWFSCGILSVFVFAVYSICTRLNVLIDKE